MQITVNGERRTLETRLTLAAFLESLRLAGGDHGVAVVVNGEVVRRAEWPSITLRDADELEIVRATMGG